MVTAEDAVAAMASAAKMHNSLLPSPARTHYSWSGVDSMAWNVLGSGKKRQLKMWPKIIG